MSTIAQELDRLEQAKLALINKLEERGVTVSEGTRLEEFPALIDEIRAISELISITKEDLDAYIGDDDVLTIPGDSMLTDMSISVDDIGKTTLARLESI